MTINEKKQLSNYIKGLVRESLGEMDSMPSWWNDKYGYDDEMDGFENDEINCDLVGHRRDRAEGGVCPWIARLVAFPCGIQASPPG